MNSKVFLIAAILAVALHQGATTRFIRNNGTAIFSDIREEISSSSTEMAQDLRTMLERLLKTVMETLRRIHRTKVDIIQAILNRPMALENVNILEKLRVNITQLKEDVQDVVQQFEASTKITPELIEAAKQKVGELLKRTVILEQAIQKLLAPMKPVDMTTTATPSMATDTTIDEEAAKFKIVVCPIQPYPSVDSSQQYCIKHSEKGIMAVIYDGTINPSDIKVVKCGERPIQWCFDHPELGTLAHIEFRPPVK